MKYTIPIANLSMNKFMKKSGFMTLHSKDPTNIFKIHIGGANGADLINLWACI